MDAERIIELVNRIVKAKRNTNDELETVNRIISEIREIKGKLTNK